MSPLYSCIWSRFESEWKSAIEQGVFDMRLSDHEILTVFREALRRIGEEEIERLSNLSFVLTGIYPVDPMVIIDSKYNNRTTFSDSFYFLPFKFRTLYL